MLDSRRFAVALIVGLFPVLAFALVNTHTPRGAAALAGDTNSPGFRLSLETFGMQGLGLNGDSVENEDVARISMNRLTGGSNLVIERDFNPGSLVPGAQVQTSALRIPNLEHDNLTLFTRTACVRGVGIGGLGFFGNFLGLFTGFLDLDGAVNSALADGFDGSFITNIVNLVGPFGILTITLDDFKAEVVRLTADGTRGLGGISASVGPRTVDPVFNGSCL